MSAEYWNLDGNDNDAQLLTADAAAGETKALGTIRIRNLGDAASGNLRLKIRNASGDVMPLSEGWVEACVGGTWSPLKPELPISLTPPAAGAGVDLDLRLVVPSSIGSIVFLRALIRAEWW